MSPGTQDSGHMCSYCCCDPGSFPTWSRWFCCDWQFLSVLNWLLGDHLLIHLDVICLGTRPLSPPSFLLSSLTCLTLATPQTKPAASRRCLILTLTASPVPAPVQPVEGSKSSWPALTASIPHSWGQEAPPTC